MEASRNGIPKEVETSLSPSHDSRKKKLDSLYHVNIAEGITIKMDKKYQS